MGRLHVIDTTATGPVLFGESTLTREARHRERFLVAGLIADLWRAATPAAGVRGITLRLLPVEPGVAVEADQQVLATVMLNLLQNAIAFSRSQGTVTLRVEADGKRVIFEIEDECGGFPGCDMTASIRPFEQQTGDGGDKRGLAFCRWGVEANHGRIYGRDLPGRGCVFGVVLPRFTARTRWIW